jgi:hypothetical protein
MNRSETIKELAAALSKAQGQFEHARKDADNPFFRSRYASLSSVLDAAKQHLFDNGLSVSQVIDTQEDSVFLESILMHSSGEWISGKYPIKPLKPDPQGLGSCVSYARRYSFSAITGIAADDDDGNSASGNATKQAIDYFALIEDSKTLSELAAVWNKIPEHLKKTYLKVKDAQKALLTKPATTETQPESQPTEETTNG